MNRRWLNKLIKLVLFHWLNKSEYNYKMSIKCHISLKYKINIISVGLLRKNVLYETLLNI